MWGFFSEILMQCVFTEFWGEFKEKERQTSEFDE